MVFHVEHASLADAEAAEQRVEHIVDSGAADEPVEGDACDAQLLGQQQGISQTDSLGKRFLRLRKQAMLPPVEGRITRIRQNRACGGNQIVA